MSTKARKSAKTLMTTGVTMSFPSQEDLMTQAEYRQHPFGQVWQPFDKKAFQELAGNIGRRGQDKSVRKK